MNLEDIMPSGINQIQKDNTVWFHTYEVPRVVKFIETESRMVVARGCGKGEMGSYLQSQSFSLENEKVLEMDGVNGC